MTEQPTPEQPVEAPATTTPAPAPAAEPPAAAPAPEAPKDGLPDDAAALKAMIADLRKENGAARTNAKAQAAADAKKELTQSIAQALGLAGDEPPDPAALTEQLTAEKTAAQQARVELAVFRAASAANGDPAALLDSTSFLKSLADVDPTDTVAVQAAIEAAVAANPRLGAAPESRLPAPNPAQGSSASGPGTASQLTRSDLGQMSAEQIVKAKAEGRLNKVLGITP